MTKYWMSKCREGEWRVWRPCLAQTLEEAKVEATRELGQIWAGEELRIANGDDRNTSTIAIRPADHIKWVDVE